MAVPYYQGDIVPIEFQTKYGGTGITATYAYVNIKDPHNKITEMDDANIDTSTITFNVPSTMTETVGHYEVEFRLGMPYGERTHFRYYDIRPNLT